MAYIKDLDSMALGLLTYIKSIEEGRNDPPSYDALSHAIDSGAGIEIIEYILAQGVSPNHNNGILKILDQIINPDYLYSPSNYETDQIIILLFEYGACYDSRLLQYHHTKETIEHFLELENQIFTRIKG